MAGSTEAAWGHAKTTLESNSRCTSLSLIPGELSKEYGHMALMVVFSDPGGGGVKGQPRASSAISHAMTLSHPLVLHAMLTPPQPSVPGLGPIWVLPQLRGSAMAVAPDEHRRPL